MLSFTYTHSVETDAPVSTLWHLYEDVDSWPLWDSGAERITRNGPFEVGVTGTMQFVGQEPIDYRIAEVEPERLFVDEADVGGLTIRVSHELTPLTSTQLRVTHTAEIEGPKEQAQHVGAVITADFLETMTALITLAKERSK